MNYLYHMVPPTMRGSTLYPLNQLRKTHPDLYVLEIKKYVGREHVRDTKIPPLKCSWGDVLHLTAVNPASINKALRAAGAKPINDGFYKIPADAIDLKFTTVYLYSNSENQTSKDFIPFDSKHTSQYMKMPIETEEYYKSSILQGRKPLLFHLIPHILYKGSIDVIGLEITN